MGTDTAIPWTTHTWNPWKGCTPIGEGCRRCYADREMRRYGIPPRTVVRCRTTFKLPLRRRGHARGPWKLPDGDMVFINSWSDFLHAGADPWRAEALGIIERRPGLTFQVPTKRADRVPVSFPPGWLPAHPNVWLGQSASTDREAETAIARLDALSAPWRPRVAWLSLEPLIGPIRAPWCSRVDWVVVGCESGPDRRPCDLGWIHDIVNQCDDAGVPVFVKQLDLDGRFSRDPAEWPEWARRFDFPGEG